MLTLQVVWPAHDANGVLHVHDSSVHRHGRCVLQEDVLGAEAATTATFAWAATAVQVPPAC